MKREELFMDILGDIDKKYIALAMPVSNSHDIVTDTRTITSTAPIDVSDKISKKDHIIYMVTRALGVVAALALVVGGGVWLWQNWDKIAVRDPDRPGVITTISENNPTPVTDEVVYKYNGCTVKVKDYEFDGLTARVRYEEIFDKDPGYDLQPRIAPCIADLNKEFSGKPFKLVNQAGLVYTWETSCTQYEPSDEITLAFVDWSVKDTSAMKSDPAYSLVISKGLVPARVIETDKAIPLTAGNVNVKAVYICENTVTVKCESSGLTGDELVELADADIKIIMPGGDAVQFALEPNTVNPVMENADGYVFTGRFNAGHIDTSVIRSVYINDVLIYLAPASHNYGELRTYPVRIEQVLPIFDERSLGIFENVFYGIWKHEGESEQLNDLHLTYSEDCFDYGHCYPGSIVETDELYALTYINGGEPSCYTVFKNEPGVIYECAYNLYNGDLEGYAYAVYINSRSPQFTDRTDTEMPYLRAGKLSNLGIHRLKYELGDDFAEFYSQTLLNDSGYNDGDFTDETGKKWVIASSLGYPQDTRYLVSYDTYSGEPYVTVGIPYYEKNKYESHDYLDENEEVPWRKYFELMFFKKGGKWQVTYRSYEPEIMVTKPEKRINLSVNTVLDLDAVTEDYTYKLIDDYESDENWQYMKEWVEISGAEKAAELRDLYRSTDYFGYPDYGVQYIGNEVCDYVIRKTFGFMGIVQYNSWEMFVFVKDGKAVGATEMMKRSGLNWYVDGNDLYEVATTENILHIDLMTFEYDWIPIKDGYVTIADINDDWFICGNGPLYAYNRHTCEIINTGMEWNGLYSNLMRLNGDRIEYTGESGTGYWYDIVTGESGEDPEIFNTPIHFVFENSEYKAHSYYNTTAEPSAEEFDFSRVSITRRSDGLTKVFNFEDLLGGMSGKTDGATLNHLLIGDWFITRINSYGRIAVNFETGESADVSDIFKDNKIWNHTVCGDKNFVEFTDESETAHLFGEIVFEVTDK